MFQLGSKSVVEGMDDKLFWTETKDDVFSIKLMYRSLQLDTLSLFHGCRFGDLVCNRRFVSLLGKQLREKS